MRKRKEYLIPLKESKKIYLEKRGRKKIEISISVILFGILAVLCLLYCLAIGFFVNYGTKFFIVWAVLAVIFGAISFILAHKSRLEKVPLWLKNGAVICFVAGVILFAFVEILILKQFTKQPSFSADYVIVLGAQWKENGPSYVLQKRLDSAIEYLETNPDTQVIVSGGQGVNEPISEAEGMYRYLLEAGIAPERIYKENQSTNTYENLKYSGEMLDKVQDNVVIVTNNFHVFRAVRIARKQGYAKVEGLAAGSYPLMLPNNMLREFFGVMKDFAVGNM